MRFIRLVSVAIAVLVAATACADDAQPAPTPVLIAFDDGWGQIFVADADGGGLRQVTPTLGDDTHQMQYANFATLSPSGKQLVYTRGGTLIELVDLGSGESKTIRDGGYQPAFSPDGSTIAFANNGAIYIMDSDGSDMRVIAQHEAASDPAFSPDGSRVIFVVSGYLVEATTTLGPSKVVLRDQFWNADPAYSPDGSTLVFSSNRGGNNGSEIYSMPVTGGDITALTATYAISPAFTPDGSRIIYTRAATDSGELVTDIAVPTRAELASMNPDGSDQKRLTPQSITAQGPSVAGGQ